MAYHVYDQWLDDHISCLFSQEIIKFGPNVIEGMLRQAISLGYVQKYERVPERNCWVVRMRSGKMYWVYPDGWVTEL